LRAVAVCSASVARGVAGGVPRTVPIGSMSGASSTDVSKMEL